MRSAARLAPPIVFLLLLATCAPDFASGIPCANDYQCPTGYSCVDQKCASGGSSNPGGDGNTSGIGFKTDVKSLDFGAVQVKDTKVQTVKVTNIAKSNAPIQVKATVTKGGDYFKSLTEDYVTVPAKSQNGNVDVQISYSPQKIESDTGEIVISSDEPGTPKITVALSGSGADPSLDVTPGEIDFGTVFKGGSVPSAKVKVRNNGQGTLVIDSIALVANPSNQYSLGGAPSMPKNLDTNSEFTFDVIFKPSVPGQANGSLLIKAEDRDRPEATVALKAAVQNQCPQGYYDINNDPKDGCECKQVRKGGKDCVSAVDLGPILDTSAAVVNVEGNLVSENPATAEDWYTFMATDDVAADVTMLCDKFHVRVLFPQGGNPDGLAMDVYQGCGTDKREGCASVCADPNWAKTNRLCEASQDKFVFALDFNGPDPTNPANPPVGECPCTQESPTQGTIGTNFCVDDTQLFYVRVYRVTTGANPSKVSCTNYKLEFSNGFYKYTDP